MSSSSYPEIEGFEYQLQSVNQALPGIATGLTAAQFNWSPGHGRWSIGQCVEHLNITAERYLPVIQAGIAEARAAGRLSPGPFVPGVFERWFLEQLEPPVGWKIKAPKRFIATNALDPQSTIGRWDSLQGQFAACIRSAAGLDLGRIKIRSQFGPVSFSLNGTFLILLAHQRRHLWQAREVRVNGGFPQAGAR